MFCVFLCVVCCCCCVCVRCREKSGQRCRQKKRHHFDSISIMFLFLLCVCVCLCANNPFTVPLNNNCRSASLDEFYFDLSDFLERAVSDCPHRREQKRKFETDAVLPETDGNGSNEHRGDADTISEHEYDCDDDPDAAELYCCFPVPDVSVAQRAKMVYDADSAVEQRSIPPSSFSSAAAAAAAAASGSTAAAAASTGEIELKSYAATKETTAADTSTATLAHAITCGKSMPWTLVERVVWKIRARIFEKTKLTASAGLAANGMLAKICSDHNKPNGQFMLPSEADTIKVFLKHLPVRKIGGIGKVCVCLFVWLVCVCVVCCVLCVLCVRVLCVCL